MTRRFLALSAAVAALSVIGVQGAVAHQTETEIKNLMKTPLADMAGKEANVVLLNVAPGWKIDKHSHPGHIFVYVIEGSINIAVEGKPARVIKAGDVVYELPGQSMAANNISSTNGAKLLAFQVGDAGEPLTVMAE